MSWLTILKRRANYRTAFDNFDAKKIAAYDEQKVQLRCSRMRGSSATGSKVRASVENAKAFLAVQKKFGSFDKFLWRLYRRNTA